MANGMMTVMRVGHSLHRRRSISDQAARCCYIQTQTGIMWSPTVEAPPITIEIGAFNTGGFHSLVVSLVAAIQNNMLDSRANPTKRVNHRGMRKTGGKNQPEEPRHERVYKNRPTRGMIGGLLIHSGVWALPFLSFPLSSETSLSQHGRTERPCGRPPLCC